MTVDETLSHAYKSEADDKYKRTVGEVEQFQTTTQEDSNRYTLPEQCVRSLY